MDSRIAIGRIRRPHGLAGAFKVSSFSGEYDHFALPKVYHLSNGTGFRDFEVEWVKLSGALTLVKLKGLDTPEQVRACLSCPKPRCTNCLGPSGLRWSELKLRARRKKAQVPGLDRQARDT